MPDEPILALESVDGGLWHRRGSPLDFSDYKEKFPSSQSLLDDVVKDMVEYGERQLPLTMFSAVASDLGSALFSRIAKTQSIAWRPYEELRREGEGIAQLEA